MQTWSSSVNASSKCLNYSIYKTEHQLESFYLDLPVKFLHVFGNFRLCNNYLPIEKGRWLGFERNDRKCQLCNLNEIGDEYHYILRCTCLNNERRSLFSCFSIIINNIHMFKKFMCTNDISQLIQVCKFIEVVLKKVKQPPDNS